VFQVNSFEQLCINYCNEKLQFHFNEHIFRMEQELYREEGITIPGTAFVDNQPTLDLLELKSTGVFSMCDEELNVPRGSDEGFLTKVLQKHGDGKHPNMIRPKAKECSDFQKSFGILHYAGAVFYNVSNFLEKNKDQLHPDIVNVLRGSTSRMVSQMFPADAADDKGAKATKATKLTLGAQFKMQLKDLISTLNSTFPHFVRCMKSNDKKVLYLKSLCSVCKLTVLIRRLVTFSILGECRISCGTQAL
jgi:myosin heavy subunit